ncbi:hypothetical protein [Candidatus Magnetominusculus xianensis]|uniref:Transposase n=1 Tax=Candidatus Magnetominusculus xianensis TaxID=1748249 RepID=A0ABR5SHW3_9BACT|nr:hypothetical protein [Candidatus Magnetominusculus xianensis]KWT89416.1 hypothetical protein ASN18_1234 [Candidatus Magnetominusculus xianensis]MBF0405505.1 hypothetical protein [Nitrospirota bacterium]
MKKIRKAHDGAFKAKVAIESVKGERHSLPHIHEPLGYLTPHEVYFGET